MADVALRDIERQWMVSRTATAEVSLIRACQRAGAVTKAEIDVAAYLGHELAREVQPNCPCWSGNKDTRDYHVYRKKCGLMEGPLEHWIDVLLDLLAALPAPTGLTTDTRCIKCFGTGDEHRTERGKGRMGVYYEGPEECSECDSTGKRHIPLDPTLYYSLVIGVAVLRATFRCKGNVCFCTDRSEYEDCVLLSIGEKADAWLLEPTEARWVKLMLLMDNGTGHRPEDVPRAALVANLRTQLPSTRVDVKAIAREAILPRLRLPPHHQEVS